MEKGRGGREVRYAGRRAREGTKQKDNPIKNLAERREEVSGMSAHQVHGTGEA